jgi:tRNA (guanine37-N1)-methyltransferase
LKCFCVPAGMGEEAIRILRSRGLVDDRYRVSSGNGRVCIPLVTGVEAEASRLLPYGSVENCSPPPRRIAAKISLPGHDRIGGVIIIRENALSQGVEADELASAFKRVYGRVDAIYVKESTTGSYRLPVLRLLWGRPVREVIHREYGLEFKVRIGDVYFNPRLSEEHRRIALLTKDGERVFDIFSGIGGFAIHIAHLHDSIVFANDLNPAAYYSIMENILLNKRRLRGRVMPLNLDAGVLPLVFNRGVFHRVIANLPHSSMNYMEVYRHLLADHGVLHLYIVGKDCGGFRFEAGWRMLDCRKVLDYAPGTFICRVDLVKIEG